MHDRNYYAVSDVNMAVVQEFVGGITQETKIEGIDSGVLQNFLADRIVTLTKNLCRNSPFVLEGTLDFKIRKTLRFDKQWMNKEEIWSRTLVLELKEDHTKRVHRAKGNVASWGTPEPAMCPGLVSSPSQSQPTPSGQSVEQETWVGTPYFSFLDGEVILTPLPDHRDPSTPELIALNQH